MRGLWNFIRWYPWRSKDDFVRWREGEWAPWSRSDFKRNWLGQWILKK